MKYIRSGLLALALLGLAPRGVLGADDAYTAGYVTAVLEREFDGQFFKQPVEYLGIGAHFSF